MIYKSNQDCSILTLLVDHLHHVDYGNHNDDDDDDADGEDDVHFVYLEIHKQY